MTGSGTNTYLVDNGAGDLAVVDPGPDDPRHLQAIVEAAARRGPIQAVLVTHRHVDHLPAAVPLCRLSGAPLVGHADLPGVQRAVADGEVAFGSLRALATPGHTRESLCFWDSATGELFTGDLVAGAGTVVLDDQPGALADYLGSLERLLALGPRTLYPGHGPVVEDAHGKLTEYLDHRQQRLQQVLDALATRGPATVDQLVGAIYTEVPPSLVAMAARNVLANLEKLEADRLVASLGAGQWQMIP
jgi:glyoxylase-like metal-dependent hydrolase (beta-lactamase superfamily II)